MLLAETLLLREERRDDLPVIHAAFDLDPAAHAVTSEEPWVPSTLERRTAAWEARQSGTADPTIVRFAAQLRDDVEERCVGYGTVWGLDLHNRIAHLGLALVPDVRGQGLGRQLVSLLCEYAFTHRDLHRVQLETLGSNQAMQALARSAGFSLEGRRREVAFVTGARDDEVLYGLLAREWRERAGR